MAGAARLDFRQLMSACVHLSRVAGRVIREAHREGQLGAHNKRNESDQQEACQMEASEVLTIADLRAQHVIVSNIRAMFPGIRLVGEEDEEDSKKEASNLEELPVISLEEIPLLEGMDAPAELAQSLTLADTCLWIDPLDGTIEFVRGNLQHVCVLIGIAVENRPVAGIVLQPFLTEETPDGVATYGAVGVGVFGDRQPAYGEAPDTLTPGMQEKCSKKDRMRKGMERLSSSGPVQPVISQGAGQNLLRVLRGETSVFVQGPGASRWDTCACEALLMTVGGNVTTLEGTPYQYLQDAPSYLNSEGLIAARTGEIHARVLDAMSEPGSGAPEKCAEMASDQA